MKICRLLGFFISAVLFLHLITQNIGGLTHQNSNNNINVIPQPRQITSPIQLFPYVLTNDWHIFIESSSDKTTRLASELIIKDLNIIWGLNLSLHIDDNKLGTINKSIVIGIHSRDKKIGDIANKQAISINPRLHPQGYKISVNPSQTDSPPVLILANTPQGVFYAAQTFRQLITKNSTGQIIIPSVSITDWPRMDYRGLQVNLEKLSNVVDEFMCIPTYITTPPPQGRL